MSTASHVHPAAGHDNRLRGPFNSWILGFLEGHFHRRLGDVRAELLASLHGDVLEVGAGNGPTLRYLPRAVRRVHAVEPNRHFHQRLQRAADRHDIDLVIHPTVGESIDLPDDSVDAAVVSWVLCTVGDPDAVLAEIRRVLRPGGHLVFFEHVRAPSRGFVDRVQRAVHGPWKWIFEGCHTNRDTGAALRGAGFTSVELREVKVATPFVPIRTQIAGIAVA